MTFSLEGIPTFNEFRRIGTWREETASGIDPPGKDPRTGAGLVNAFEAVRKAMAERKGK